MIMISTAMIFDFNGWSGGYHSCSWCLIVSFIRFVGIPVPRVSRLLIATHGRALDPNGGEERWIVNRREVTCYY